MVANFQIIDNKIYDPNGQEFIIKGANMFAWEDINNVDSYINNWGFNTIRVPNYLLGNYNQPHPELDNYLTNHRIVDAYTSQGTVVIFDAHDRIGGYYEGDEWEVLKDYWRDMAQEFKDNPHVWFNLHNEPGNATPNPEKWIAYHRELIEIIRGEGANNLIIVGGEAWGQDYHTQTIASHALEVMTDNENILFSIHVYDQWNHNKIGAYFDELQAQGIPIIVGEYGSENVAQDTLIASQKMLEAAQEREIGRIVWNVQANDNNDLTTGTGGHAHHFDGTNEAILTELGQLVWDDLQRTEDLEQLSDFNNPAPLELTEGVFEVDETGQIQFDFLFDGAWTKGELAIFNLEGMENYTPGTQEFIYQAALRAVSNSEQGHIILQDTNERARFNGGWSTGIDWEYNYNFGQYLDVKTYNMNPGDRFGLLFVRHGAIQEIVNDAGSIWKQGKIPYFSIPEANPGFSDGQMVAVDSNGTFAWENYRVDWFEGDQDYNDIVFQLLGASTTVSSIDDRINPDKDWRNTDVGQELLDYTNRFNTPIYAEDNNSDNFNALASIDESFPTNSTVLAPIEENVTNFNVLTPVDDRIKANSNIPRIIFFDELLQNDHDLENLELNIIAVDYSTNGTLSLEEDHIIFTSDGISNIASFEYVISDGISAASATVNIDIELPEKVNSLNDELFGTLDDDLLSGLEGNDSIKGKLGDDTLDGGEGSDIYNIYIYDDLSGDLFYDRDGNGDNAQVIFAQLDSGLKLSHDNFWLDLL